MNFVWMLLIGLTIGIVAKLLLPGREGGDTAAMILMAIGGSMLVGYVGIELGWYGGPLEGRGTAASVVGAMLLLFLYSLVEGRRRRAT